MFCCLTACIQISLSSSCLLPPLQLSKRWPEPRLRQARARTIRYLNLCLGSYCRSRRSSRTSTRSSCRPRCSTIFGISSPVGGSEEVTRLIGEGWESQVVARLEFGPDPQQMIVKAMAHIDKKRAAQSLAPYDPSRFGSSGDRRMHELMDLPLKERVAAIYGREK